MSTAARRAGQRLRTAGSHSEMNHYIEIKGKQYCEACELELAKRTAKRMAQRVTALEHELKTERSLLKETEREREQLQKAVSRLRSRRKPPVQRKHPSDTALLEAILIAEESGGHYGAGLAIGANWIACSQDYRTGERKWVAGSGKGKQWVKEFPVGFGRAAICAAVLN